MVASGFGYAHAVVVKETLAGDRKVGVATEAVAVLLCGAYRPQPYTPALRIVHSLASLRLTPHPIAGFVEPDNSADADGDEGDLYLLVLRRANRPIPKLEAFEAGQAGQLLRFPSHYRLSPALHLRHGTASTTSTTSPPASLSSTRWPMKTTPS